MFTDRRSVQCTHYALFAALTPVLLPTYTTGHIVTLFDSHKSELNTIIDLSTLDFFLQILLKRSNEM
jgi:hypothetical protein